MRIDWLLLLGRLAFNHSVYFAALTIVLNFNPYLSPMNINMNKSRVGMSFYSKILMRAFGLLLLALTFHLQAGGITWGSGVTIAGDTDVATNGTFLYGYYFASSGGPTTVNGVAFTASTSNTSLGGGNVTMNYSTLPYYTYYPTTGATTPWTGLSSAYRTVLSGGPYSGATATINLNNLTSGHTYLVQFWVNDSRTGYSPARYQTPASLGGNSVNVSNNVSNVASGVGAYAIGIFVASGTTQAITDSLFGIAQINAIQVRDITGLPANNGVWNTLTPGAKWGTAANWTGNTIANGSGNTADFSQLNPTADTTNTLDAPWVIGTMIFGDTDTSSPASWILGAAGYPGSLLLAGSAPTIQVNALGTGKVTLVNASMGGTNGLIKTGSGTLTLAGNNNFTGGLTISNGTVVAPTWAAGTNAQSVGEGNITLAGGTLSYTGAATTAATQNFTNAPGTTSSILVTPAYLQTSGFMTGSGNLNIGGVGTTGTLIFQTASGVNSFSGNITIGNGTLQFNSCDPGNNASFVLNAGGTLALLCTGPSATRTLGSLAGNGTVQGGYGNHTTTIQVGSLNASTLFSGSIIDNTGGGGGHAALTVIGGTLALSGANTYSGITTLSNGTLCVNGPTALSTNTLMILGGMLDNTSSGANTLANNNAQIWNGNFTFTGTKDLNLGSGAVTMTNGSRQITINGGNLTVGGVISDSGLGYALTKLGIGTLTLTNANTYSGNTTISSGTLVGVTGGSCASSAVSVAATSGNSATLSIAVLNTANQWTCSSLTVNNAGIGCGLNFNFGSLTPSTSVAPLNVSSTITLTTAPTISVAGLNLPISSGNGYPLVTWGSGSPTTNGMVLNLPARIAGNLAIVGNTLYLQITGSTEPLTWQPGAGTWDAIASNWKDNTGATTTYLDGTPGDSVVFDDTPGAGSYTVTLNSLYKPAGLTLNLTNANYTFSGTGAIGGSTTPLVKNGNGTLTLNTTNTFGGGATLNGGTMVLAAANTFGGGVTVNGGTLDLTVSNAYSGGTTVNGGSVLVTAPNNYTGGTTINGGSVQLGDGLSNNGSVSGIIADNAALVIANPVAQTNNNAISGTGSVTKSGQGSLTISGANTFAGGMNINSGTVVLGSGTALGATTNNTVIASGATLDLAGIGSAQNNPVVVSGGGVSGANAITSSSQIASPFIGFRYVTLAGDTVLNTPTRWDIGNNTTGGTLTGNGHKLTLVGTNAMSLNILGETDLGDIAVSNQTLYIQGASTTLGRTTNTVYVYPGSSLNLYGNGINITKPLALNGGSLANGSGSPTYSGPVTVNANSSISAAGTFNLSGVITGTNALTFTGGMTELTATNTFSGLITNISGTLQFGDGIANLGSVATTNIAVNGGTVSFANFTNQTFSGNITGGGTLSKSGAGEMIFSLSGSNGLGNVKILNGTADFPGGMTIVSSNTYVQAGGTGQLPVMNLNGANITNASSLCVGYVTPTGPGTLNINSGTLISGSGYLYFGYGSGASMSTINVNGGLLSANQLLFSQHGNATLWLNGGVIQLNNMITASSLAENYSHMYFNGGTLKANSTQGAFITAGLHDCNVSTNTSTIDNSGYAITIPVALESDPNLVAASTTDGGLIFTGTGTNTLTGVNTYTGPTVVQNGTLVTSATNSTSGGALVMTNATLNLNAIPSSLNVASITATNSIWSFNLGTNGNPAFPVINAAGNYTAEGIISVKIQSSGNTLTAGNLVLIHYTGSDLSNATYATPKLPTGFSGTIIDDTANKNITLVISAVPAALTWIGTTNNWDSNNVANLTWVLSSDLATTEYYTENFLGGPSVTFDDNVGAGITAINLEASVSPFSLTVNNSSYNYSLTGAGKITGQSSLTKSGSGTFVLGTANDYTNGTVISGGTLLLTNGSNRLPPGGSLTFSGNGTLDMGGNNQDLGALTATNTASSINLLTNGNITIAGAFSVGGGGAEAFTILNMSSLNSLTMNQPSGAINIGGSYAATVSSSGGEVFLPANSTITVNQLNISPYGAANSYTATNFGWLHLGQAAVINASQISIGTIRSAGTLDFAPGLTAPTVTIRNTNGVGSRVDQITVGQNPAGSTPQGFGLIDLSQGYVSLSASNVFVGTIWNSSAPVGLGTITVSNSSLDILNLTLGRNLTAGGSGGPYGVFNQAAGTNKVKSLIFGDNVGLTGVPNLAGIYNLNGGLLVAQNIAAGGGTFNTNTSSRVINWSGGTIKHYDAVTDLTINGVTGGSISLVLGTNGTPTFDTDSGRAITIGANAIINGDNSGLSTLIKTGPGSLILNCTNNNPGLTIISNGMFGGTAVLAGSLVINTTATLSPGAGSIGLLTVNSNLNLAGDLLFKLNKSLTQSNDYVIVNGGLTNLGIGTLTLTNIGVTPLANGDSFKLFSQPVSGGGNLTINPATPGTGLIWTNLLSVNGTIAVITPPSSVATNQIPISFTVSGGSLNLSWPPDHLGWRLLAQTNSLATGLGTNWVTVAGSTTVTNLSLPISELNGSVFYQLVYP